MLFDTQTSNLRKSKKKTKKKRRRKKKKTTLYQHIKKNNKKQNKTLSTVNNYLLKLICSSTRSTLLPILCNLQVPFPLQVDILIIICELAFYCVGATRNHTRRCLFHLSCKAVRFRFRPITSNHELGLVNC